MPSDAVAVLLWPFLTCMLLSAIHGYLGYHVISRGVIFVDLSLAQIAALGAMVATAASGSGEASSATRYLASLTFAIVGAGIFAFTSNRHRDERVPQEATIGITYAVAAALVVLVANSLPHGAQEIQRTLVGSILWVDRATFVKTALIYAAVGVVHWFLRAPFFAISTDPKAAAARGLPVRWLDFAFYATFAVVITSSVAISGVLLVFSFLVVPAVAGALLAHGVRARLLIGWGVATLGSSLGLAASWHFDLPTGAAIVAGLGATLIVVAIATHSRNRRERQQGSQITNTRS